MSALLRNGRRVEFHDIPGARHGDPVPLTVYSISITGLVCLRRDDARDSDGDRPLMSVPLSDFLAMCEAGIIRDGKPVQP